MKKIIGMVLASAVLLTGCTTTNKPAEINNETEIQAIESEATEAGSEVLSESTEAAEEQQYDVTMEDIAFVLEGNEYHLGTSPKEISENLFSNDWELKAITAYESAKFVVTFSKKEIGQDISLSFRSTDEFTPEASEEWIVQVCEEFDKGKTELLDSTVLYEIHVEQTKYTVAPGESCGAYLCTPYGDAGIGDPIDLAESALVFAGQERTQHSEAETGEYAMEVIEAHYNFIGSDDVLSVSFWDMDNGTEGCDEILITLGK